MLFLEDFLESELLESKLSIIYLCFVVLDELPGELRERCKEIKDLDAEITGILIVH